MKERGITLVALIITIIILIILVGITIKGAIDNGMIKLSVEGTQKYAGEAEKEMTLLDKIVGLFGNSDNSEEAVDPDVHLPNNVKVVEVRTDKEISKIIENDKVEVDYEGNKITNVKELEVGKYSLAYNEETKKLEMTKALAEERALNNEEGIKLYVIGEEYNDEILDISGKNHTMYLKSGTKVQKDLDGDYYLNFDGTDDYGQITELEESINWADGFEIEFVANWRSFNNWSRILDFGNGPSSDNLLIANNGTTSNLQLLILNGASQDTYELGKDNLVLDERAKYNIKYSKKEDGKFNVTFRKNDREIFTLDTTYTVKNILRTLNYLGKSNWSTDRYFNGKVYALKITQADGDVILHYDIDKMLNKKKTNVEIASSTDWDKFINEAKAGKTFFGRTISLKNDITLGEHTGVCIPKFEGTIDGNGKKIIGLNITGTEVNTRNNRNK